MISTLQNVIQSRKIYVKMVKICNDLGLKDLFQLSKIINLCGRSHLQIMPNTRSITERQDLFTIFILFNDNLKNTSGFLVWYLHKESVKKKKSSKTNCGVDIRALVNILPVYRDLHNHGRGPQQHLAISWELTQKGLLLQKKDIHHLFHLQGRGILNWGMEEPTTFWCNYSSFLEFLMGWRSWWRRWYGRELCRSSGKDKLCWK